MMGSETQENGFKIHVHKKRTEQNLSKVADVPTGVPIGLARPGVIPVDY